MLEFFESIKPIIGFVIVAFFVVVALAAFAFSAVSAMELLGMIMGDSRFSFKAFFGYVAYLAGAGFVSVLVLDIDPALLIWAYGGLFAGAMGGRFLLAVTK